MIESLVGLVVLSILSFLGLIQGNLEKQLDARASIIALARLIVFAVFAVLLLAFELLIGKPSPFAIAVVIATFILQQLFGKFFVKTKFAERIAERNENLINLLARLLRPFQLSAPEETEEFEQELLDSVEEFSETLVREVMVPRVDLEVVDATQSLEEALSVFISTGYSRLPVVGESVDDVVGVLYLKDVARVTHKDPALLSSTSAKEASRKPLFTPETKPVHELLQEMKVSQTQIAIVSDEYGGVAGIATMEDLIEEIVGEISDEYDRDSEEIELIEPNLYRLDPKVTLAELAEEIGRDLEDPDVETVGGLLSKALGELPKGGERVEVLGLEITAERVEPRKQRVLSVLVRVIPAENG